MLCLLGSLTLLATVAYEVLISVIAGLLGWFVVCVCVFAML